MSQIRIPLIGGAYAGRTPVIDTQTMINYYVEGDATDARGARYAVPTPGITLYGSFGSGAARAVYYYEGYGLLAVIGDTLYHITSNSAATALGTLATSTGRVQMVDNGFANGHQVLLCDSLGNGYVFDSTAGTVTQLTNATNGWPNGGVGTISWQDGYGLLTQNGTGVLWWTNAYDFTTINGLNFATAEGNPDNLVSCISDAVRVYLSGTRTTEVWYDQGLLNEAFARLPGAIYFQGSVAKYSAAIIDSSVVWLGCDKNGRAQVLQARGTSAPLAISTATIEYWFNQYSTVADAYAFTYQDQGHLFYILTFPTAGVTWAWDATTQQWHQRSTNGLTNSWLPFDYTYRMDTAQHYVVDGSTNNIYYLDRTATTDNGVTITRQITGPYIINQHDRTFGNAVELMTNAALGSGPTSGTITLAWSKNNASSFGAGAPNGGAVTFTFTDSPTQRLIFRRLGWARQWVFRVTTTSNPIIFDLLATPMQIERIPAFPSTEAN